MIVATKETFIYILIHYLFIHQFIVAGRWTKASPSADDGRR